MEGAFDVHAENRSEAQERQYIVTKYHPWYDPAYEASTHNRHAAWVVIVRGSALIEGVSWPGLRLPFAYLQQDEGT